MRKLEFLLADVIDRGCDRVVLDGTTQSNCAMALSHYGPPLGLAVDLVLYGSDVVQANYLGVLRSGASVTLLRHWSEAEVSAARGTIMERALRRGERPFVVPTGATSDVTVFAGIELAREIAEQERSLGVEFEYVICPSGTGGTHAGLELGRRLADRSWKVIGIAVANDSSFFDSVLHHLSRSPAVAALFHEADHDLMLNTCMDALGDGYGCPLPGATAEIARLRRRFGMVLDSVYTHKGFVGMQGLVGSGAIPPGTSVLFVHTGGVNERFADHGSGL